jgi:cytidylate kinase
LFSPYRHASELEEAERRVAQAEMQAGSSRTTLELVKEQMARDADERIRNMHQMHHQQLGMFLQI